jgi:hypothetical protein
MAADAGKSKGITPQPDGEFFEARYRSALEHVWDRALHKIAGHPSFEQVERELES